MSLLHGTHPVPHDVEIQRAWSPPLASRPTALGLPGRLLPHDQPWGPFVIEVATG